MMIKIPLGKKGIQKTLVPSDKSPLVNVCGTLGFISRRVVSCRLLYVGGSFSIPEETLLECIHKNWKLKKKKKRKIDKKVKT